MLSREDLHDYQNKAIEFIKSKKRCGLALDMGLGKTATTLTTLSDLSDGLAINKVLIIAPLRVANTVWAQEARNWHHLKHLNISICTGNEKQRMSALHAKADIYVINRENVVWLTTLYKKRWPFDTVVIDECFPEGTLISTPSGLCDIKYLKTGDYVMTSVGKKPITKTFRKETNEFVKLYLSDGSTIECTRDHPFATEKGWLQAWRCGGLHFVRDDIYEKEIGTSVVQQKLFKKKHARHKIIGRKISFQKKKFGYRKDAICIGRDLDLEQRKTLARGNKEKIKRCSQEKWTSTFDERGEWESFRMRKVNARNFIGGLGYAMFDTNKNGSKKRVSNLLQSGFWNPSKKDSFRNRWKFSQISKATGRKERYFSSIVRVDSIENIQYESERVVYNLETDGINDYFANGILVHNCSSFKSASSQRFKALKKVLHEINYIVLLSATPASNGLMDIWSQQFFIDFGMALGRTMTAYKSRFFESDYMGYNFSPREGSDEKIHQLLEPHWLSMAAEDYIQLPQRLDLTVKVQLEPKVKKAYQEFEKNLIATLPEGDEIEALSAAALAGKLLQWSNGTVYTDDKRNWALIHDSKLDALEELIEANAGENILVAYNYRSDLARLTQRFPKATVLDKGGEVLKRWNEGKISMLLAHPQSAGHGLNAQHGGSIVIWFGLNWSLDYYLQFNGRVYRQGQLKPVRIIHLVAEDTIDERVMSVLADKDHTQKKLLAALKPTS